MKKKKKPTYTVYDSFCSCIIKEYRSKAAAEKRRIKELTERNLLEYGSGIVVIKDYLTVVS